MNRPSLFFLAAILVIAAAAGLYRGYVYNEHPTPSPAWQKRLASMGTLDSKLQDFAMQIEKVQGESKCTADSQCRVEGLGAKTCGEYKDFLIYSTDDADEPKLLTLIAEFNRAHENLVNLSLKANQCGSKPAPVYCVEHRCLPELH